MNQEERKKSEEPSNRTMWVLLSGLLLAVAIAVVLIINPFRGSLAKDEPSQTANINKPTQKKPVNPTPSSNNSSSGTNADSSSTARPVAGDPWKAQMSPETKAILEKIIASQGGLEAIRNLNSVHMVSKENSLALEQFNSETLGQFNSETLGQINSETWIRLPEQIRQVQRFTIASTEVNSIVVVNGLKHGTRASIKKGKSQSKSWRLHLTRPVLSDRISILIPYGFQDLSWMPEPLFDIQALPTSILFKRTL